MAFRRIPVRIARRFFIKRRFTIGVVFASVPFLGYLLIFGRSISVPGQMLSTNIECDCPLTKQQTRNSTLKTEEILTSIAGERKVEHDSENSTGSLNAHMWHGICGMNVDILRNWPHFPYLPDKRSFVSKFRKTQVLNMKDNGERIFGFVHPQRSGMYKFAITSDDTSELWLSRNEDPASSEMIARVFSLFIDRLGLKKETTRNILSKFLKKSFFTPARNITSSLLVNKVLAPLMLLYFGVTGIQRLKLLARSTCQVFTRMKFKAQFPHTRVKNPRLRFIARGIYIIFIVCRS